MNEPDPAAALPRRVPREPERHDYDYAQPTHDTNPVQRWCRRCHRYTDDSEPCAARDAPQEPAADSGIRRRDTPENRAFWDSVASAAAEGRELLQRTHPDFKRDAPQEPLDDDLIECRRRLYRTRTACGFDQAAQSYQKTLPICCRDCQVNWLILELEAAAPARLAVTREQEICICAAIQLGDGYVIRGHRHDDCYHTMFKILGKDHARKTGHVQGFVTSHNRFVDRREGMALQVAAGIASRAGYRGDVLFSEDLY